ncbi:hypothetical protein CC78DRAFT_615270 [Lojkania enalia]|uniref:Uncharacterized protein n=1 Tax=Lojkania enalia TaxID=147567 RepID=A0A9P4KHE3_9PLEO|nr:hypothetical protein CC78DRAFT_615270 [Didymosphaeria enalia]
MPLNLFPSALGSPSHFARAVCAPIPSCLHASMVNVSRDQRRPWVRIASLSTIAPAPLLTARTGCVFARHLKRRQWLSIPSRHRFSSQIVPKQELQAIQEVEWESTTDIAAPVFGPNETNMPEDVSQRVKSISPLRHALYRLRPSRGRYKRRRQSQPGLILDAIQNSHIKDAYNIRVPGNTYAGACRNKTRNLRRKIGYSPPGVDEEQSANASELTDRMPQRLPVSLYTILHRCVEAFSLSPSARPEWQLTDQELKFLQNRGFLQDSVEQWAACILDTKPQTAANIFRPGKSFPPLFLLLLFLRRRYLDAYTLGIILRHVNLRTQVEPLTWTGLKILSVRLTRHARRVWPESIPWVASMFTNEVTKLIDDGAGDSGVLAIKDSDLTHFCNSLLSILALPASLHPFLSSAHQEMAQFEVLKFMANHSPALIVTQQGFRSVARVQLARPKSLQEREWAKLKGPSWPPWKEDRTAMDEGKGREFGMSKASQILQRMYEGGYVGGKWEQIIEMYAGWDTDWSPTIQTRSLVLDMSTDDHNHKRLEYLLWAARVRTTRSRREAWACFLEYEGSGTPARKEVYQAMFEKLLHFEFEESKLAPPDKLSDSHGPVITEQFPGDMKEVWPDPKTPLHLVYLKEPIPSFEQLYRRMREKGIKPNMRLLALLIGRCPDFTVGLEVLVSVKSDLGGGLEALLEGSFTDSSVRELPPYFVASFLRFLCRFGRYSHQPSEDPIAVEPSEHHERFVNDRHYLLECAYALLVHLRPSYRPVWTAYMEALLFQRWGRGMTKAEQGLKSAKQYRIMCNLLDKMQKEQLELDDEQFQLVCTSLGYVAQNAYQGHLHPPDVRHVLTESRYIRKLFHDLVSANLDPKDDPSVENKHSVPPHIPGPTVLHTYVRALAILHDYEGLYSFATWAHTHHTKITARVNQQRSGPRAWRRTLIALRAGITGRLHPRPKLDLGQKKVEEDLVQLVKAQIEGIEEWGGWPSSNEVNMYNIGVLKKTDSPWHRIAG